MDTFQRLLVSSDPLINLQRDLTKKKEHELTEEIRRLLIISNNRRIINRL